MDKFIKAILGQPIKPNRVQHLVVSDSKHLYLRQKDEFIGYQQKALDPRTCGSRKMLKRLIAVDEETGVFYGELWPRDEPLDLVGFFARAWASKRELPLRGFPQTLCVPAAALADSDLECQIRAVVALGGIQLERAASGFGPTTVAAREYERQICQSGAYAVKFPLRLAHMASESLSLCACHKSCLAFAAAWESIPGLSPDVIRKFDSMYDPPGDWRSGDFSKLLHLSN